MTAGFGAGTQTCYMRAVNYRGKAFGGFAGGKETTLVSYELVTPNKVWKLRNIVDAFALFLIIKRSEAHSKDWHKFPEQLKQMMEVVCGPRTKKQWDRRVHY